jgi:hypothetical protein
LTEQDRDNIRAFKLDLISKMPRVAFEHMRYAFSHKLDISSHWVMIHRVAILSRVEPVWYHCCPKSCIAYAGAYSDCSDCPFCEQSRFNEFGKPRRLFCYLPIIPRLQGFFSNPKSIESILYRHNYQHRPNEVSDVFDGIHYRTLLTEKVTVDGTQLSHCYFSGKYDIALGICMDSYLLFDRKRKGPSATPILLENYNICPETRTHLDRSFCAGVIPGPHNPKDYPSFLHPFDEECVLLAIGVPTYNCITKSVFNLHAYTIIGMGDMLAIEKLINIKGHNGFCPCRSCKMKGARNTIGGDTIYYLPLTHPDIADEPRRAWNPNNLPLRTHQDFIDVANKLDSLNVEKQKKDLAFDEGIKGLPALRRVGSLNYARSFPWDIMHLFFENIIRFLLQLWSGKFKGLDVGLEDYEIPANVWEEIWLETAEAIQHIPADFVRSLVNGPGNFTAEAWCFWFVYMAPILLKGRFKNPKYHVHLCDLSTIIKICITFTLTYGQIEDLRQRIIRWLRSYEE